MILTSNVQSSRAHIFAPLLMVLVLITSVLTIAEAAADLSPNADTAPWVTDDQVWAITQVGDTIFVGGMFSAVAPSNAAPFTSRPFLAAFDAETGDFLPGFAPTLDGDVRALASSGDGSRLYVAGEFSTVNGQNRPGIVSLDPATGEIDFSFDVNAPADATIFDIEVDGDLVYIGGQFSTLNGSFVARAARVKADTGAVDTSWQPRPNAQVEAISIPPDGSQIYLGGRFTSLDGVPARTMASVTTTDGAMIRDFAADTDSGCDSPDRQPNGIRSIDSTNDRIFAMPYLQNCIHVYIPSQSNRFLQYDMDGDVQVVHLIGDRFLVGGHSATVDFVPKNRLYAFNLDGTYDPTLPTDAFGQPGVFAAYSSGTDLWIGGTIWAVGATNAINDLARIGPGDGESIPSTPTGVTATAAGNSLSLNWSASADPDGIAGYRVLRGNEQLAFVTGTSYTDVRYRDGELNQYHVEAIDSRHNKSERSAPVLAGFNGVTIDPIGDQISVIGDTVNLTATATAGGAVAFSATGLPDGVAIDANGTISGAAAAAGTYATTVTATAAGSTDSTSFAWDVVNDTIPVGPAPLVRVSSPTPGVFLEGGSAAVTGLASDDSGVAGVDVSVRNRTTGLYLQPDLSFASNFVRLSASLGAPDQAVSSFTLPLAALPSGSYTINARPVGVDGDQGDSVAVDFTMVDSLGAEPYGDIQFPKTRTNVYGAFSIIGTATDDIGVASVEILVKEKFPTNAGRRLQDDYTLGAAYNTFTANMNAAGEPVTRFWLDLPAGLPQVNPWQIRVIVTDTDGNVFSETLTSGFGIDGEYYAGRDAPTPYPVPDFGTTAQRPVLTVTAPAGIVTLPAPLLIQGTASDNVAVNDISIRVRNDIGWYLQTDGSFASALADVPASVTGLATASASFLADAGQLPLGDYTVEVTATDSSGLAAATTRSVTIEGSGNGPAIDAVGDQTGDLGQPATLQLVAASPIGPVSYQAAGLPVGLTANGATGLISGTFAQAGTFDVTITVTDTANVSVVETFTWTVEAPSDTSDPNSTIDIPSGGDVIDTGLIAIAGQATDDISGVSAVRFLVRDRNAGQYVQADGTLGDRVHLFDATLDSVGALNTAWNATIALPAGRYVVVPRAFDIAGNVESDRDRRQFVVADPVLDNIEPDTTTTTPQRQGTADVGVVTLGGQATDADSGVAGVQVNVRNRDTGNYLQANGTFGPGNYLWDTALDTPGANDTGWSLDVNLPEGRYAIVARATDVAGNLEVDRTWHPFVVAAAVTDFVAPTSSVATPAANANPTAGVVSFEGTAGDDASGVNEVELLIRNSTSGLFLQLDGSFAGDRTWLPATVNAPNAVTTAWSTQFNLPPARYVLRTRAVDAAGNVEVSNRPRVTFEAS